MDAQTDQIVKPILDNETKWLSRVTKATLYHLNGTVSEIKLIVPIYTNNGEASELSYHPMVDYVCSLTTWFIKISGFVVSLGSIDVDGNEDYAITYEPIKIPLGKVYHYGEWVDPELIKEEEMRNRISACNS
jgi:hypothetical protein